MSPPAQTLRDLVDKAMVKHDVKSASALARVGKAAGYNVSHTTISDMRSGKYPWTPSQATIEMLADLAGVSREEAYGAADMGDPGVPYEPPTGAKYLTPKQREVVDTVIRALVEAQEPNAGSDTERTTQDHERVAETGVSVATLKDLGLSGDEVSNIGLNETRPNRG